MIEYEPIRSCQVHHSLEGWSNDFIFHTFYLPYVEGKI